MFELIKFELYKIASRKYTILVLSVFILLYFLNISQFNLGDIQHFRNMHIEWNGPLTEERVAIARQELRELEAQQEEDWEKYIADHQSQNAVIFEWDKTLGSKLGVRFDLVNRWDRFQNRNDLTADLREEIRNAETADKKDFNYLKNLMHYNMLSGLKPPSGDYFRGWGQLIDSAKTFGFVVLGALILLTLAPVFADEYAVKMDSLILSSRHGRKKVVTAKIVASLFAVFSYAVILLIINVAVNSVLFSLDGSQVALQELFPYRHSPFNLNVSQYFFIQQATHLFGAAAFSLLVLLLSVFSRNALIPFFTGGAIYAGPFFLTRVLNIEHELIQRLMDFSYSQLIIVEKMFSNFHVINLFGMPVLYLQVMYFLFLLISAVTIYFVYSGFAKRQVI
ncbi:MAG: hypothetical protein DDT21_01011 [Syntrophomonadaceae bacterium]|nr:hypothetical protein [Bacillota bacterium]